MKSPRIRFVLQIFLLLGLAGIAFASAAEEKAAAISEADKADIARIEAYLGSIRSLKGRFIQISSSGGHAEGRIYIRRPGLLRLDYAPPATIQLYGDGTWLIYVDNELQQVSHVAISDTPASVLLDDKVWLSGAIRVTRIERRPGVIRLHLIRTEEPDAGILSLTLTEAPLTLRQWDVTDAQQVKTRITLLDTEFNVAVDDKLFVFETPDDWIGQNN